ncbi:hypothetical protein BC628DRAFT_1177715 [Trametes gibbosa]|nr:hypothetical protein BC628DRAFT_1177715 [Trametes gibbosa]
MTVDMGRLGIRDKSCASVLRPALQPRQAFRIPRKPASSHRNPPCAFLYSCAPRERQRRRAMAAERAWEGGGGGGGDWLGREREAGLLIISGSRQMYFQSRFSPVSSTTPDHPNALSAASSSYRYRTPALFLTWLRILLPGCPRTPCAASHVSRQPPISSDVTFC